MASVRDLKKDINYVLGDMIEIIDDWQKLNPDKDAKNSEKIIDEIFEVFDDLMAKVNAKDVENKKTHFKAIQNDLQDRGRKLIDKINALS